MSDLVYYARYKTREMMQEAEQQRLAWAARNPGEPFNVRFAPVNGFGQMLLVFGTRLIGSSAERRVIEQKTCISCAAT
jgi:hypothetical protein